MAKALVFEIKCLFMWLLVLFSMNSQSSFTNASDHKKIPDSKTVKEFNERLTKRVTDWGYKLKTYEVFTEDDYILKLHRLFLDEKNLKKEPVLIMHGVISCSPMYLAYRNSLAYYLVERKYDVWVGNARGTLFSTKHKKMKPSKRKFWDFSFHEMGYYDVPAIIDKITQETGVDHVHYVGYSMGTTVFLAMAATQTNTVRDKVASVTLVAPVARPVHYKRINNKYKIFLAKSFLKLASSVTRGDIFTHNKYTALASYTICSSRWFGWLCEKGLRYRSKGRDLYDHVNSLDVYPYFPCGASIKSFLHFIQLAQAEKFQQYDYGRKKNQLKYKQPDPLEYNLDAIEKEMYLIVGGQDSDADKKDIEWMHHRLKNSVYVHERFEDFDHRDFEHSTELNTAGEVVLEIIEAHIEKRVPNFKKMSLEAQPSDYED